MKLLFLNLAVINSELTIHLLLSTITTAMN